MRTVSYLHILLNELINFEEKIGYDHIKHCLDLGKRNNMDFIQWCNVNNGFLTAVLSLIGLILSVIAIVVSIRTARLPYKKILLLGSSFLVGVEFQLRGTETSLVGMSFTATNVGNRTISLTYLGLAIKKDHRFGKMYPVDRPFDCRETLEPSELFSVEFSRDEIIKGLSGENQNTKVYAYASDTEGTEYKKRIGTIGKVIESLKE